MAILTAAELRQAEPDLGDTAKFPSAELEDLVDEFTRVAEEYRGHAFELRYEVETIDLTEAATWLRLRWPLVRAVSSITVTAPAVDGTTTTLDSSDYTVDRDSGDLHYPAGFPAGARVVVTYSHGAGSRRVTDGATTDEDTTVTSATAAFTVEDIGAPISGTGIPARTTIASVNSTSSVELSAAATATGTGVTFTIGAPSRVLLSACETYVRSRALADRSGVPRDVIGQTFEGSYTRYSTPDLAAGRPTGYLDVDRLLNSLPDRRRIL